MKAQGEFDVNIQPLDPFTKGAAGTAIGRLSITKTFTGDLSATSLGEMLSARTSIENSAGYVAIEQAQGTLHGMIGTFVLMHTGLLDRGEQRLVIEVVPDSGTGQMENITGSMQIRIDNGRHFYELEYQLP